MNQKVLITGGAGYIGSVLCYELLKKGYSVKIVDNFLYGQNSISHLCKYENFDLQKADVRNVASYKGLINEADVIIPLAALVGAPICKQDPIGAKSINYTAVEELFSKISNQQIVLMPTTNSAYGSGDKDNFCDENSPLNPISEYAKEKVDLEKRLMDLSLPVSLRLATVFGMSYRMRTDLLVNDFTLKAVKDKSIVLFESHFKRNYIHVLDVSYAFIHCLENFNLVKNNIFNIGLSDANLSKKELCEEIKKQIPELVIYENETNKDPDQRNYIVSNEKIEKTGFKPKCSLEFGIKELIKGYRSLKLNQFSNI